MRGAKVAYAAAVVQGYIEAAVNRMNTLVTLPPRAFSPERRRNPRKCVLCGGPMMRDRRPARRKNGSEEVPEVLEWYKCCRCGLSQAGLFPGTGRRAP